MRSVIEKGNVVRKTFPGKESLNDINYANLYLGSGNCGGLFDAYGFMHRPYIDISEDKDYYKKKCNTAFLHQSHFTKGKYGLDYHIPLLRVGFLGEIPDYPTDYLQELNIYEGVLNTKFENKDIKYSSKTSFNPYLRDVLAFEYEFESLTKNANPSLGVMFMDRIVSSYENEFKGSWDVVQIEKDFCKMEVRAGTAESIVFVRTIGFNNSSLVYKNGKLQINSLNQNDHGMLLIAVANVENEGKVYSDLMSILNTEYFNSCILAWNKRWGNSYVDIPDETIQSIWSRSVYYLLCTYSPEPTCPAPPIGWTGNLWNYHFAQDFSYIMPALLRLGHLDIAKGKIEFYRSRLDVVKRNTKRIYGVDGAMWPWEFPIGEDFEIMVDGFPNWFQFEIHNAAYPARMAYETALHLNDDSWTNEVAWPIMYESALFYKTISTKTDNGKWDLFVEPSMGQDEHGSPNSRNYLCALYSATYCFKIIKDLKSKLNVTYIDQRSNDVSSKEQLDNIEIFEQILSDGYNFEGLYNSEYQIFFASEKANKEGKLGILKHPVPLNPLFAIPLEDRSEELMRAYEIHERLCDKAWPGHIHGWTLAAYWVSASHMGKADDLIYELSKIPGDFMDKEMIEFWESSILHWMQYYTTIHGLYLQAINDSIVSDFWGEDQIGFAFPKEWKGTKYYNLASKSGQKYSGTL